MALIAIKNNVKIEQAKTAEINYFNDRRKALGIKYKNEELAEANKAYEDKLALLERQKNDEINSFNTLEDLKKSLVGRASVVNCFHFSVSLGYKTTYSVKAKIIC